MFSELTRDRFRRFRGIRRAWWSLLILSIAFVLSLFSEFLANDKPLILRHQGKTYFPVVRFYPESNFGLPNATEADYLALNKDASFKSSGGWMLFPPVHWGPYRAHLDLEGNPPHPPSRQHWLGTDNTARDVLSRLLYGFRLCMVFALVIAILAAALGILIGGLQGYVGGWTDMLGQRFIEIWSAMPELYLLIIFSAVFDPSISLLLILLGLFGWMGLSDYVRAEFLRNRQMDYVRAARALGLGPLQIIWRHVLPNSMTPVVTFLPFRMSAAILALTSLDFLGLGVPPGTPSLGEMLAQGKNNIDAWWISMSTFALLVLTLLLLTFMGDALRNALDPRLQDSEVSS